jgi:hypothetical protein
MTPLWMVMGWFEASWAALLAGAVEGCARRWIATDADAACGWKCCANVYLDVCLHV